MRSVEMVVEYPIEDSNFPMPHLIAAANAAFVEEAERQGLLLMSAPSPSVMHARRIVEVRAAVVEKPDWVPELRHDNIRGRTAREGRGREVTDMDMVMAAVLVIGLLGSLVIYLWQDWYMSTREFREIRRRLLQMQEDRQKGETND